MFLFTVQAARAVGPAVRFAKTFTLSEFSETPGVKVKVETPSESDDTEEPMVGYSMARPFKRVTVLLFPTAAFFSPSFFKNLPGFAHLDGFKHRLSGFKPRLVVAGPDKVVLSCTSVSYEVVSDGDDPEPHINFTFYIAADLMQSSCLFLDEWFPRNGGQWFAVYLGARP